MENINFIVTNLLIGCAVVALYFLRLRKVSPEGNPWILQYPMVMKICAVVGFMLVCTGVSVVFELTHGIEKLFVVLLAVPVGGMAFMAAAEVFVAETSYDEFKLYRCSPWKKRVELPFDDVVHIQSSWFRPHIIIHSQDGRTIRILKWNDGAADVLGYAQEALEIRTDTRAA